MVEIICSVCDMKVDMPNRCFRMCENCSRQKRLDRCKSYKARNKEYVSDYNKKWKQENKEYVSSYNKEYNTNNRTDIQTRQTIQHRERRKTDMK